MLLTLAFGNKTKIIVEIIGTLIIGHYYMGFLFIHLLCHSHLSAPFSHSYIIIRQGPQAITGLPTFFYKVFRSVFPPGHHSSHKPTTSHRFFLVLTLCLLNCAVIQSDHATG